MDPNLRAPYVQTWSVGVLREVASGTVVEVRYAGNHGVRLWHGYSVNEVNIFENGFLPQFKAAQQNLAISQANGRGASFANNGLAGQTAIPIFETAFNGLAAAQGFNNATFLSYLNTGQAGALATSIAQNPTYFCRMVGNNFGPCASRGFNNPGIYPINTFVLNPYQFGGTSPTGATNANYITDNAFSNYNALQVEVRKRFSKGLTFNFNYAWSHSLTDRYNKNVDNISNFSTLRNRAMDRGPSPFDIRHVVQGFRHLRPALRKRPEVRDRQLGSGHACRRLDDRLDFPIPDRFAIQIERRTANCQPAGCRRECESIGV